MTLTDVLIDFALISVLLVISAWLRRKVKFFQHFYIPVALIAGVLGLLLGPQVLGSVSPIYFNYSSGISQWSGVLSAVVFSCSFLGLKLEKVTSSALQTYFLAGSVHQIQVIVGLTLALVFGYFMTDLPLGFGILPVLGFYGGHGMAIAAGTIYDDSGYMMGGSEVAATFATIGMLVGVIVGMIIINRAAEKGITTVQMKREDLPKEMLTGYYPPDQRGSIGNSVTASSSLDPLGSQLMMVGFIVLCGYILRTCLIKVNSFFSNLPLFACCLIFSAVFSICTQKNTRINNMIDRKTVTRISGSALEYMITAALATTSLKVFTTYGLAMVAVSIAVTIATYLFCFVVGKAVLPKNGQFETGIGLFGQCCGNLATGLLLLKVVDPDFKTNGATNITSSSTLGYTYQLQYTLIFVALVMTRPIFVYAYSWLLLAVLLGAGLLLGRRIHKKEAV